MSSDIYIVPIELYCTPIMYSNRASSHLKCSDRIYCPQSCIPIMHLDTYLKCSHRTYCTSIVYSHTSSVPIRYTQYFKSAQEHKSQVNVFRSGKLCSYRATQYINSLNGTNHKFKCPYIQSVPIGQIIPRSCIPIHQIGSRAQITS